MFELWHQAYLDAPSSQLRNARGSALPLDRVSFPVPLPQKDNHAPAGDLNHPPTRSW
jgi:hypothetical protein